MQGLPFPIITYQVITGNYSQSQNKKNLKKIITRQTKFNEYIDRQKKQLKQLAAKVVMGDTDESI